MKIKEKLKKCITGVGAFFTTITTKVFATDVNSILMEINGASAGEELYGIVNPLQDVYLFSNYVLKIWQIFSDSPCSYNWTYSYNSEKRGYKTRKFEKSNNYNCNKFCNYFYCGVSN